MNVLLIDDDPSALSYLAGLMRSRHDVTECVDGGEALRRLKPRVFDVVFTDLRMPPPDGFEILKAAQSMEPPVPVIVLTAVDNARPAVEALRLGARDFLVKPADAAEISRALALAAGDYAWAAAERDSEEFGLIGRAPSIQLVRKLIPALARSREAVLIVGETGTGKELLARALHAQGPRSGGPFVAHNMAATPVELAEAIFVGHARGAFSGAISDHRGLFEQADGGTLFLDEVDSFPGSLQAKLLRLLEGGVVQRIGAGTGRAVDVRVIAASATELCSQVSAGLFRADLYYRLRQLEVVLPPLRDRAGDVEVLVDRFLDELSRESGLRLRVDPCAMDRLLDHSWPGNVRELRNVVRAAAVVAGAGPIRLEHFPRALQTGGRVSDPSGHGSLHSLEMSHIREVLERAGGNQSQAARILGIDRGTLARKLAAAKQTETTLPEPGHRP